jgi:anti-sigma factor RsiW
MTLLMSLSLDGMLSEEERQEFEAHLARCAQCQSEWERWQSVDVLLKSEPVRSPTPEFSAGVLDRLAQRSRRQRRLVGGALLVGGSLSAWGMVVMALAMAAFLWILSDPAVAIHVAHVGSQVLAAVGVLVTAARLALAGVLNQGIWPWLAIYFGVVLALTSLWMRVVRRRPSRPTVSMFIL